MQKNIFKPIIILGFLFIVVAGGYFSYKGIKVLRENNLSIKNLGEKVGLFQESLDSLKRDSDELYRQLLAVQDKNTSFEQTISGISDTVGTLQKLSKTDRELLQKYSKVFFLNENYVPSRLANIDEKYLSDKNKPLQFHALVLHYLTDMLNNSISSNTVVKVVSAYRSFGTQANLKSGYVFSYGTGANSFSAEQGYSEHQLGTTVDLAVSDNPNLSTSFDQTAAFSWLKNNAYRYGFVLSYPQNNSYYQYEPWHWRFVGVKLATRLHEDGMYFYDLTQRDIDRYLVDILS
mgnify:CR=1 FL=1